MDEYTLEEPTKEEADALTKDLQAVLEKYQCEMGVKASISLMKRVPIEGVISPITREELESDGQTPETN